TSVFVFIAVGGFAWDWSFVLLLIPILFFHELGHFVAMRFFRYRNVRMFFIPLLGAAVSGNSFAVDGWKKAIVSLAGPLPGLMVSIPMGIASIWFQNDLLYQATLLTIVLNLFNLLPFLPLDGGWVMHALFFSRSPVMDVVFRVVAAVGLIGLGGVIGSKLLAIIAGSTLFALPAVLTHSRIASSLKERRLKIATGDTQEIPIETVVEIVNEMPKGGAGQGTFKPAQQANIVLQIYELLAARPPGLVSTLLLTFAYMSGWGAGIIGGSILLFSSFAQEFVDQEFQSFSTSEVAVLPGEIERTRDSDSLEILETKSTFIAELPSSEVAKKSLISLQVEDLEAIRLGSLIVGDFNDSGSDHVIGALTDLESESLNFYKAPEINCTYMIRCLADSPEAAATIERQFRMVLTYSIQARLSMPWDPNLELTNQQSLNRETLEIIEAELAGFYQRPDIVSLQEKLDALCEKDDVTDEEFDAKQQEHDVKIEALRESLIEQILTRDDLTSAMVEHYRKYLAINKAYSQIDYSSEDADAQSEQLGRQFQQWNRRLGNMLGSLELNTEDEPTTSSTVFSVNSGNLEVTGNELVFSSLDFERVVDGWPAMLRWLEEKGCSDFRVFAADPFSMFSKRMGVNVE
ncbi:MAG: site-2 protease family protein, partial [Planctomycetota bacterium]